MKQQNIKVEKLEVNIGQLDGLPQNPRIVKDRESTKKQGAKTLEINLVAIIHLFFQRVIKYII
ncbi:MAG: hypothetical protein MJZ99_00830 [Bacteroidales bacterium]|nr:hypothetical protein [Bacteroidales bacterium]